MIYENFRWIAVVSALTLSACGDSDDHTDSHGDESPEAEACEHMETGPAQDVSATETGTDAPSIAYEHTRVDVGLFEGMDANSGFATFPASETGEYIFFLNNDTSLKLTDANGTTIDAEATEGASELCPTLVTNSAVYDLTVGTYTVEFGPTSNGQVSVVVEASEHEH